MKMTNWRHLTGLLVTTSFASVALLWAWNTLAEITGAPTAEFKHAVAALALAFAVRLVIFGRRGSLEVDHRPESAR